MEMENFIYLPPLQTHLFLYKHDTNHGWDLLCCQWSVFYQASPTSSLVWPILPAQSETCPIRECNVGCNLASCKGTKTVRASLRQILVRRIRKRQSSAPAYSHMWCRHPPTRDLLVIPETLYIHPVNAIKEHACRIPAIWRKYWGPKQSKYNWRG